MVKIDGILVGVPSTRVVTTRLRIVTTGLHVGEGVSQVDWGFCYPRQGRIGVLPYVPLHGLLVSPR